jgi:YidC/Oxa1 family membrane protein insertase
VSHFPFDDPLAVLITAANFFDQARELMRDLLSWIHSGVGSWGIAIILLTIIVRIVIFPLTWKQIRSQLAMQSLQPKLKELQQKYRGDKQKLQQKTMELYQQYRVNPFASCLPLLLQLPIFILLYYAIRNFGPLEDAKFLWFALGKQDPYYVLLIIYVASQLVATELMLTPETPPQQKWMMRAMPLFFVFILRSFPSGLFVYWITTNLWTIGQTLVIRYLREHRPVDLEAREVSGRKKSRFLEAMATAQARREEQQGGTSARPSGNRPQPKKGARPGGQQGRPGGKPRPKQGGKPQGKQGERRPAGAPQAKPGAKPQPKSTKPQPKPGTKQATRPPARQHKPGGQAPRPSGRPKGVSRPSGDV